MKQLLDLLNQNNRYAGESTGFHRKISKKRGGVIEKQISFNIAENKINENLREEFNEPSITE